MKYMARLGVFISLVCAGFAQGQDYATIKNTSDKDFIGIINVVLKTSEGTKKRNVHFKVPAESEVKVDLHQAATGYRKNNPIKVVLDPNTIEVAFIKAVKIQNPANPNKNVAKMISGEAKLSKQKKFEKYKEAPRFNATDRTFTIQSAHDDTINLIAKP